MNKITKSFILFLSLIVFSVGAKAQLLPLSLGIKGGINASNTSFKDSDARVGYNAGLTLDLYLPSNFAIFTGIDLTSKGGKTKDVMLPNSSGTTEFKSNAIYMQIPVKLGYRIDAIPGLGLHFGAGPYFAQGIGGKTKYKVDGKETKFNTFGDGDLQYKKFDWGLGVEVGAKVLGLVQVRIGYDFGLVKIDRADEKIKNRNFYASLGFNIF